MPEHAELEQEIKELHEKLSLEGGRPERKETSEREIWRKIVREKYLPPQTSPMPEPATPERPLEAGESAFLPHYLKDAPPDVKLKVEELIEIAWHEGNITKALEKATHEGLFFLNAFHDALADRLYEKLQEMKRRGVIK